MYLEAGCPTLPIALERAQQTHQAQGLQLQRVIDKCCIDYSHDVPHQQWLSPRANLDFAETLGAMITPHALYERPYMGLKLLLRLHVPDG